MTAANITILATGGTIAGSAGSATGRGYSAGQVSVEEIIAGANALGLTANLSGEEITRIGSQDMGWEEWQALYQRICALCEEERCDAVIITHGTDTAEETGFLLDLALPAGKPVILVGAMRPADAIGSDGLRNFVNAVHTASDLGAAGRGVMLVMGDFVLAASDARKSATANIDAFRGYPRGSLAHVTPAMLDWYFPPDRIGAPARFAWPEALPRVDILYACAGMDGALIDHAIAAGAEGLVLAGMGNGNAPSTVIRRLSEATAQGLPVVRASRVDQGPVDRGVEVDDDALGFVASRSLSPQKARILLQLCLANGLSEASALQAEFDVR